MSAVWWGEVKPALDAFVDVHVHPARYERRAAALDGLGHRDRLATVRAHRHQVRKIFMARLREVGWDLDRALGIAG